MPRNCARYFGAALTAECPGGPVHSTDVTMTFKAVLRLGQLDDFEVAVVCTCRIDQSVLGMREEPLAPRRSHDRISAQALSPVDTFPRSVSAPHTAERGEPSSMRHGELATRAILGVTDGDCLTLGNFDASGVRPAIG